jgi:hypothetical protein
MRVFEKRVCVIREHARLDLNLDKCAATYQMIAMGFKWMMTEKEPEPVEVLSKTQQKKQKKAEKFGYAR